MPLKTYDESIDVLRRSLDAAKVGDQEKLDEFARLERFVRAVEERCRPEADFQAALAHERATSTQLKGRTASGRSTAQLPLFD